MALFVWKLPIFNSFNELQPLNNSAIFWAWGTLKFLKSKKTKELQFLNIEFIFWTFDFLKLLAFKYFKDKQFSNIDWLVVTFVA